MSSTMHALKGLHTERVWRFFYGKGALYGFRGERWAEGS